jgi:hypothetical protein
MAGHLDMHTLAGKGGMIKCIMERVSPRIFRVVALPSPTERQKTQLPAQRYIEQLPILFLAPLVAMMPQSALAALVIVYSFGLIKPIEFREINIRRTEFSWRS